MMAGILILFVALAIARLYPRGTEPLFYDPAVTLAGAAGLVVLSHLLSRIASSAHARRHRANDPRAGAVYGRTLALAQSLVLLAYGLLVFHGHWPLLTEETVNGYWPFPDPAEDSYAIVPVTMAANAVNDLLVLAPLLLALVAGWVAHYPAERTMRGGDLPLGAFLRFRAQSLIAFGLAPVLLLMAVANGLAAVPLWRRELDVYPFLVWAGMGVLFLALFAVSPPLLAAGVRARPVPPGPLRERLEACCARAGFRCRDLLVWNTCGTGTLNAFIAGPFHRLRHVFFTDALLERLAPEEVEAVLAHEIGHAACRHLRWYGILSVGFVALTAATVEWVNRTFGDALIPQASAQAFLLVLYFAGILGALSRRFETEADLFAARLIGDPFRFASALARVVRLSGGSVSRGSLRHPSPAQRIAFLAGAARFPLLEFRFLLGLRRLTALCAVGLLASFAAAWYAAALQMEEAPGRRTRVERQEEALRLWREADERRHDGRGEEALDLLQRARDRVPDNPRLLLALGEALDRTGRHEEARTAYEAARAKSPRELRLRQFLADRLGAP